MSRYIGALAVVMSLFVLVALTGPVPASAAGPCNPAVQTCL